MNCERSERRDWQRIVAMGLGRQLTKAEAKEVEDAWRTMKNLRKERRLAEVTVYPKTFIARWRMLVGDYAFPRELYMSEESYRSQAFFQRHPEALNQ